MRPFEDDLIGKVQLYLDGKLVDEFAGEDVKDGIVTVDKSRLYKLIMLDQPGRHVVELKFLDGNVEVYAFTFG